MTREELSLLVIGLALAVSFCLILILIIFKYSTRDPIMYQQFKPRFNGTSSQIALRLEERLLDVVNTYEQGWNIALAFLGRHEESSEELDTECERLYNRYASEKGNDAFRLGAMALICAIDDEGGKFPEPVYAELNLEECENDKYE